MTRVDPDNESTFHVCVIKSDQRKTQVPKDLIFEDLKQHRYGESAVFAIKLALEEALTNAVKHGNGGDPSKKITVRYAVNGNKAVIAIRDEGAGFDPDQLPDPTCPERVSLSCGRGVMLIRAYMDEVEYREGGTEIFFVKRRA